MQEFVQRSTVTEVDPKTGRSTTHRVKKLIRRYDPDERVEIVREFLTGKFTVRQIMDKYMINAEAGLFSIAIQRKSSEALQFACVCFSIFTKAAPKFGALMTLFYTTKDKSFQQATK